MSEKKSLQQVAEEVPAPLLYVARAMWAGFVLFVLSAGFLAGVAAAVVVGWVK